MNISRFLIRLVQGSPRQHERMLLDGRSVDPPVRTRGLRVHVNHPQNSQLKWPFSSQEPARAREPAAKEIKVLRLDLGCGKCKRDGFLGIDRRKFEGVDGVTDLTKKHWLFEQSELGGLQLQRASLGDISGYILPNDSVTEVHCAHFLEHLEHNQRHPERVRFMNELWRVLIPGGIAVIITPHWASNTAYGDFTHADKPVSELFYSYLNREWRQMNAPDNDIEFNSDGYSCDFDSDLGHSLHPDMHERTTEERGYALKWNKEAAMELFARLTARK